MNVFNLTLNLNSGREENISSFNEGLKLKPHGMFKVKSKNKIETFVFHKFGKIPTCQVRVGENIQFYTGYDAKKVFWYLINKYL